MNYFRHKDAIYQVRDGMLYQTIGAKAGYIRNPRGRLKKKAQSFGYVKLK